MAFDSPSLRCSPRPEICNPENIDTREKKKLQKRAILWDIDGTLCDSFQLGFDATAKVLKNRGVQPPTAEEYHACTRYTTPVRLARHCGLEPGSEEFDRIGTELGAEFDELYISLVDTKIAGLYPGIKELLDDLYYKRKDILIGALTNAAV